MFAFIILDKGGVLSLNSLGFKTKINTKDLATVTLIVNCCECISKQYKYYL